MPLPNHILTLAGTDSDYKTGAPFDSVAQATIAGVTGYDSETFIIWGGAPAIDAESEKLQDADGAAISRQTIRKIFEVKLYPFTWDAGDQEIMGAVGTPASEKEYRLAALLAMNHLWIHLEIDSRDYPNATDFYPVTFEEISTDKNYQRKRRTIDLTFMHKYPLQ